MEIVNKIERYSLCLGCGLCTSILKDKNATLNISDDGFYHPSVPFCSSLDEKLITKICPAIHVHIENNDCQLWGKFTNVYAGWSTDSQIRYKAASGGIVTSLAICALEQKYVDAVLQVGVVKGDYLHNELKISRSAEEIVSNAQSRYAPAPTLAKICQILETCNDTFLFIGKPCDIIGLKNLIRERPKYEGRIKLYISIFCAGIPSYNASIEAWESFGRKTPPTALQYRGNGWPGFFRATWSNGECAQMSYKDSWGKILGKRILFRCKICPDGIGLAADIAVGDCWNTKDGYPDFTDAAGKCFIFERTEYGKNLIANAKQLNYISIHTLSPNSINDMQPYQYERRKLVGWRILAVQLKTRGFLFLRGLFLYRQSLTHNFRAGIGQFIGTLKRIK